MVLRKDYVQQIQEGKAQVKVEKTEQHNEMLNIIFPKRKYADLSCLNPDGSTYYRISERRLYYTCENFPYSNLPIIHADDIILDNTVIRVESKEHGKDVFVWWKEQGVYTRSWSNCEIGFYYGMYAGDFAGYPEEYVRKKNKKIITLPETFPSKWYLPITKENKEVANEWRRSVCGEHYKHFSVLIGETLLSKHFTDGSNMYVGSVVKNNDYSDYSLISTQQFLDHVYTPWKEGRKLVQESNQKQENMKRITFSQAQEIIDIACANWKDTLWGKMIVLKKSISVDDSFYQEMRKACTEEQHEVLDRIFGKENEEINLYDETDNNSLPLFKKNGGVGSSLIAVRRCGDYKDASFILNSNFEWKLKKDNYGELCLIPTYKDA